MYIIRLFKDKHKEKKRKSPVFRALWRSMIVICLTYYGIFSPCFFAICSVRAAGQSFIDALHSNLLWVFCRDLNAKLWAVQNSHNLPCIGVFYELCALVAYKAVKALYAQNSPAVACAIGYPLPKNRIRVGKAATAATGFYFLPPIKWGGGALGWLKRKDIPPLAWE